MSYPGLHHTLMPSKKCGGNKQLYLRCRPFQWPCRCIEAMHVTLPKAAWPGLHQMPLEAAIRRLLCIAPMAARVTANKTLIKNVPTLLAVLMARPMRWYYNAHIAQWRRFMAFIKATKCCHRVSTCSDNINRTCQPPFCWSVSSSY